MANNILSKRLNFRLHDFLRYSWVSENAKLIWANRFLKCARMWDEIEKASLLKGTRLCLETHLATIDLPGAKRYWQKKGLVLNNLSFLGKGTALYNSGYSSMLENKTSDEVRCVIGSARHVRDYVKSWIENDHSAMGRLLGYPSCCVLSFEKFFKKNDIRDPAWWMAGFTKKSKIREVKFENQIKEVNLFPLTNVFLRYFGVRIVPHLPCSFECKNSAALAYQYLDLAKCLDFKEELKWVQEILSWSFEWSALHGIAEMKFPVIRVIVPTEATGTKYLLRANGNPGPLEKVNGVRFPYARVQINQTTEPSFKGNIGDLATRDHHQLIKIEKLTPPTAWIYQQNGFTSLEVMVKSHTPIVECVTEDLKHYRRREIKVLDLGCGNGQLLKSILYKNNQVIPYGIDRNPEKVRMFQEEFLEFSENIVVGDLFSSPLLWPQLKFDVAILALNRLFEAQQMSSRRLRDWLKTNACKLVLYQYPDVIKKNGTLSTMASKMSILKISLPSESSTVIVTTNNLR